MTKVTIELEKEAKKEVLPIVGDFVIFSDLDAPFGSTFVRQVIILPNNEVGTVNPNNGNVVRTAMTIEGLMKKYSGYEIKIAKEVKLEVK